MTRREIGIWYEHADGERFFLVGRGTKHSVGYDLPAIKPATVGFGRVTIVDTGVKVSLPYGTFAMVCPRSGLAAKHGITVVNAPGIIDPDYNDTIKVILTRVIQGDPYQINAMDKIAQLVIVQSTIIDDDHEILPTRQGGLGSTGA